MSSQVLGGVEVRVGEVYQPVTVFVDPVSLIESVRQEVAEVKVWRDDVAAKHAEVLADRQAVAADTTTVASDRQAVALDAAQVAADRSYIEGVIADEQQAIAAAGQTQINAITAQGASQVLAVAAEGNTQFTALQSEAERHINEFNARSADLYKRVEESGLSVLTKRVDESDDGNYLYIGEAQPGTLPSAAGWKIQRLDKTNAPDIELAFANGSSAFTAVWDDRLTYTYS